MKVAIVYNRESRNVINLFGTPNQEKIGIRTIDRVTNALKDGGHQAVSIEGDKNLIDRLEEFMPRVIKGERPGMVFNVSYGIQGQARYTHVPSILEMVGIPYVGSGPLTHSLALDKVVSKVIFRQHGLPTADFSLLKDSQFPAPDLEYPLIVKPKNEAVSFGIRVVQNEEELRDAAGVIFKKFSQPVLVERYIEGREINVGLLGNDPPEALPPAEVVFDAEGPRVYTYEDKTGRSGRNIEVQCPADLPDELAKKAQSIAKEAFDSLGCCDCSRVDMRLDGDGNFYILEINSLPSLGEHGSYTHAAAAAGLDYTALVNRLVEVASARYFGTPAPPAVTRRDADPGERVFQYLTRRRDRLENRVAEWVSIQSRTMDPIGVQESAREAGKMLTGLGLEPVGEFTDSRCAWTWETSKGLEGGALFVGHLDIPLGRDFPVHLFRKDPERLSGEGVGSSRGPLVMLEFALEALRAQRLLRGLPLGVLLYTDEGRDCRYSSDIIRAAMGKAKQVLVLRPGNPGDRIVTQRRGQRKYQLLVEGKPRRLGQDIRKPSAVRWANAKMEKIAQLSSRKGYLAISPIEIRTEAFPMLLPHRADCTLLMSYLDPKAASRAEEEMRGILGRGEFRWELEKISDRPPMKERRPSAGLVKVLRDVAAEWEIPLGKESSLWPSVAGLAAAKTPVVCGIGPVAENLYTPREAILRISLVQRTLLLAEFLVREAGR